jgi:hypothetical protein
MSDGNRTNNVEPCERCETRHVPGESCAPLQLCPECGMNGGGIPCGHYYDAIGDVTAGNLLDGDVEW